MKMSESNSIIKKKCQQQDPTLEEMESVSLCEVLDRILNKGVVVMGEVTLSLANVDLVYLNLRLLLTTIDRCKQFRQNNAVNEYDN